MMQNLIQTTTARSDSATRSPHAGLIMQVAKLGSAATVAALLALSLVSTAAAQTSGKARYASQRVVVKIVKTKLGASLVNAKGLTVYLLTADTRANGKSTCYHACAKAWPPLLTTGKRTGGPGVDDSFLGLAKRADGTKQVTYKGHRLYLFVKDKAPGQINGQGIKGFGGPFCTASLASKPCAWYALSPDGSAIKKALTSPKETQATKLSVSAGSPSEFKFTLSKTSVPLGTVTFTITNKGTIPHDFKLCSSPKGGLANTCTGRVSALVSSGASSTLTIKFTKKGTYEYLCTVAGHAAAGMKGILKVI
jgi:predicted lipoprotein with Yx(FWY)xxD motif/plastocyanin